MIDKIKSFFIPLPLNDRLLRPMTWWEMYGIETIVILIILISIILSFYIIYRYVKLH